MEMGRGLVQTNGRGVGVREEKGWEQTPVQSVGLSNPLDQP